MENLDEVYRRYQELQRWVGWTEALARRVAATTELLAPHLPAIVKDVHDEINHHPNARKVIPGGQEQIIHLTETLIQWLLRPRIRRPPLAD